ncbi:hypothetical protein IQ266_06215, partial [filamentous cyanobacterium LEGE 11480]|nr:hypothetical protein [Romeriopsis navalis LEGE 11480]
MIILTPGKLLTKVIGSSSLYNSKDCTHRRFSTCLSLFGLGAVVAYLHIHGGQNLAFPGLAALIPNLVLALLLVFRTNTAHDRFWEGRKSGEGVVVNIR